ncbi:MAG TPA: hypothetical protein PKA88_01655 [Polyangiaceae bacterium]|nr:hypothetical protein [Polyangiaceae bacterium]HMR79315.1 hypothetical protein [Polyangiaceae bacterium]
MNCESCSRHVLKVPARLALQQAIADGGLDARPLELANALLIALDEPDAGARWLAGERLFDAAKR